MQSLVITLVLVQYLLTTLPFFFVWYVFYNTYVSSSEICVLKSQAQNTLRPEDLDVFFFLGT